MMNPRISRKTQKQNNKMFLLVFGGHIIVPLKKHSRGQHLCKFIGANESVYIRRLKKTRLVWGTNMAVVSLFWDTSMVAMTSCENTQHLSSFIFIFDGVTVKHRIGKCVIERYRCTPI